MIHVHYDFTVNSCGLTVQKLTATFHLLALRGSMSDLKTTTCATPVFACHTHLSTSYSVFTVPIARQDLARDNRLVIPVIT